MTDLAQLAREVAREDLPRLLGQLAEAEAVARVRLLEPQSAPEPSRTLDPDEAAAIASVSRRWLLAHTKGLRFRDDKTRKMVRFDERGLRAWLAGRRR